MKKYVVTATSLFLFFVLGGARQVAADEVTKWNEVAAKAAFDSGLSGNPLFHSRVNAITQAAIHDALNAINRLYRPYALNERATPGASPEAAVATAAHDVLVDQFNLLIAFGFPPQQAALDAAYVSSLGLIADGPSKTAGIAIGKTAAAVILDLRESDGWNTQTLGDVNYPQGTAPGEYRFTPPFNFAFAPQWGTLPPFTLHNAAQFRPGHPYAVSGKRYTADFNEVKSLGGDGITTSSARTPEQTQFGLFWIESSPLGWNRIARTVSANCWLDLWENARLFGLLNLSVADAYIAHFDVKYHYKFWRPVTAVHLADSDGNPDTLGDSTWTPLQFNYPTPDYVSGHSTAGGAASQALEEFFGTDNIGFSVCSLTLPPGQRCTDPFPIFRSYVSFSQAAEENALSRILIGIHFRNAVEEGVKLGRKIGKRAANLYLRPVH